MIYYITNQPNIEEYPYCDIQYKIEFQTKTIQDVINFINNNETIQVDTETDNPRIKIDSEVNFEPEDKIRLIQIGNKQHQFVIDTYTVNIAPLKTPLEERTLVFQNAKFDLKLLYNYNIYPKKIEDTFLAESVLFAGYSNEDEEPHSDKSNAYYGRGLDDLALKYCQVSLFKSIRGEIHKGITNRVIEYSASDVMHLEDILVKQKIQLKAQNLLKIYEFELEFVLVLTKMEYDGVLLDKEKWSEVARQTDISVKQRTELLDSILMSEPKLRDKKIKLKNKSIEIVPKYKQSNLFDIQERELKVNYGSPEQKLQIINNLGIDIQDTNDISLNRVKNKHRFVKELIEFNKDKKRADSFGYGFLNYLCKDNRLRTSFNQIVSTGRISSRTPNLLNIPNPEKSELGKLIRESFIPTKGYKMICGDYSGMELRIVAELSKEPLWIKLFNEGKDLHSELAALTFNIPLSKVKDKTDFKADITYRSIQKTINFGLIYGMSEYKLADTMEITTQKAQQIIQKFFAVVPHLKEFLNKCANYGVAYGHIYTPPPFERKRFFPRWSEDMDNKIAGEIKRASMNTPIQGANGDIIKHALIQLHNKIEKHNYPARILLSVYDEIVSEAEESFAEEWLEIQKSQMIESAKLVIKSIPVEVDIKISNCWSK